MLKPLPNVYNGEPPASGDTTDYSVSSPARAPEPEKPEIDYIPYDPDPDAPYVFPDRKVEPVGDLLFDDSEFLGDCGVGPCGCVGDDKSTTFIIGDGTEIDGVPICAGDKLVLVGFDPVTSVRIPDEVEQFFIDAEELAQRAIDGKLGYGTLERVIGDGDLLGGKRLSIEVRVMIHKGRSQ